MLFTPSGKKSHIFARVWLTLALVVNLTLPAFASDFTTGSAFAVDERLLAVPRLASASAPVGSSTDPYYVRPFTNGSATVYRYSWSISNLNGSSSGTNQTFTNFADIVSLITSSIANSFLALGQRLHYDNDAIYLRLYDILTAIRDGVSSPENWVSDSSDFNGLIPSASSSRWTSTNSLNSWNYYRQIILNSDGERSSVDGNNNMPLLIQYKIMFTRLMEIAGTGFARAVYVPADSVYNLTDMDSLESISLNHDLNSGSIWDSIMNIGSNLSYGLSRLVYVLANEDDIALRQSQHDNMQAVKNDFTSGDVSVSPAKLGGLKSVGSALSDGFASSASVSDGLSVLGSGSDAWKWFSDENAQAFDSVSSSRNSLRLLKSGSGYLEQYYKDVSPYVN